MFSLEILLAVDWNKAREDFDAQGFEKVHRPLNYSPNTSSLAKSFGKPHTVVYRKRTILFLTILIDLNGLSNKIRGLKN